MQKFLEYAARCCEELGEQGAWGGGWGEEHMGSDRGEAESPLLRDHNYTCKSCL